MEQLAQYMEKAFIFEESGFLDEAVQLCNKCIQAFPEFKDDIELELAKMCFRNHRIEQALIRFIILYQKTGNQDIFDLILDSYYKINEMDLNTCYESNYRLLEKYDYYYGEQKKQKIRYYPLLINERVVYYFDRVAAEFHTIERCCINMQESDDNIYIAGNLLWEEDILNLEKMTRRAKRFLDAENALFLVYETEKWELLLQILDLKEMIEVGRIIFCNQIESLEQILLNEYLPFPTKVIGGLKDSIENVLQFLYIKLQKETVMYKENAMLYYTMNGKNIQKHIEDGRPKILFTTSRFTTALQYHTRDCKEAADRLGCTTMLQIEKSGIESICVFRFIKLIAEFMPDILFTIDHFRHERSILQGLENLVFICWAQDPIYDILGKNTESKLGVRDIVLTHYISWKKFWEVGYDKRRVIDAPIPADHHKYKNYELTTDEKKKYGCDLCFVCHGSDLNGHIQAVLKNYPEILQEPVDEIYKGYARYVFETGNLFFTEELFREYISGAMEQRFQLRLKEKMLNRMAEDMLSWFSQSVYRQALVDWLLDAGYDNIKLWGNGWMQEPKYAAYAMGPAENGETLSKIYQASKIVVGNNMRSTAAARAWESMLSGAFYMSNYIPPEEDCIDIRMIMKADEEVVMFYDKQDFLNKVEYYLSHEEERNRMAAIGQKVALERMTYDSLMKKVLKEVPERLKMLEGE